MNEQLMKALLQALGAGNTSAGNQDPALRDKANGERAAHAMDQPTGSWTADDRAAVNAEVMRVLRELGH